MKTTILLLVVASAICLFVMSCASAAKEEAINKSEEIILDHNETSFLEAAIGNYSGPNLLWLYDPNKPEESVATVQITATEINYSWEFQGKPQTGRMVFHLKPDAVDVDWVDSFHAADGFKSVGTHSPTEIKVLCHYGEEGKPQWGWRTELTMPKAEQFLVEMFNISPDGKEEIAVRIVADRLN